MLSLTLFQFIFRHVAIAVEAFGRMVCVRIRHMNGSTCRAQNVKVGKHGMRTLINMKDRI